MDNRNRQSSILKQKVRVPLQEVMLPDIPDDETVTTTVTRSRRVSFGTNFIKEFIVGSAVSTQCVNEYEHVLSSSDSSRSATASHLFEQSTFSAQENIRLSTEGCALNLSMNKSHSENVSVSKANTDSNRYEFEVDKQQLSARSEVMKQSKNLGDLHLGPEKVINKHEELNRSNAEKRTKCGKFSSTICFSADSPTADMEFTEGCINLAKSILDKKKKAITVFIQAKPKEMEPEGDETYVFETSDAEMSITKCIKPDEDPKINKSIMDVDDFTDSDMEDTDVGAPFVSSGKGTDFDGLEETNGGILKAAFGMDMDPDIEKSIFSPKKKLTDVLNFPGDDSLDENMSLDESQIELNLKNQGEATYLPQSEGMELTKCVGPNPVEKTPDAFQSSAMDFTKCVRDESMNMSGCEPVLMEETPCKKIPLNKSHVSFVNDLESSSDDSMDVTGCLNVPSNPDVNKMFSFPLEKEKIDSLDDLTESGKRDSVDSFVGGLFTGGNNRPELDSSPEAAEDWKLSDDSLATPLETSLKKDFEDSGMDLTEGLTNEILQKSPTEHLEEKLAGNDDVCGNDDFEDGEEEKENQDPLLKEIVRDPEMETPREEERLNLQENSSLSLKSTPEKIPCNDFAEELSPRNEENLHLSNSGAGEVSKMDITPARLILDDDSHVSVSKPEIVRKVTPVKMGKMELSPAKLISNDDSQVSVSKSEEKTPLKKNVEEKMEITPVKLILDDDSHVSVSRPVIFREEKSPGKHYFEDFSEKSPEKPFDTSLPRENVCKTPEKVENEEKSEVQGSLEKSVSEEAEKSLEKSVHEEVEVEPKTPTKANEFLHVNIKEDLENLNASPKKLPVEISKRLSNSFIELKLQKSPSKEKLNDVNISKGNNERVDRQPETEEPANDRSALNLTQNSTPEELVKEKSSLNLTFHPNPESEESAKDRSALNLTFNPNPETEELLKEKSSLNLTFNPNTETEDIRDKNSSLTFNLQPETELPVRSKPALNLTFNNSEKSISLLPRPNLGNLSNDSAIEPDKVSAMELDASMNEEKTPETEPKDHSNLNSNTITLHNETPHNDRTAATFTITPKNATYVVPNQTYVLEEEEKAKQEENESLEKSRKESFQRPQNESFQKQQNESFQKPQNESFQKQQNESFQKPQSKPESPQKLELPVKEAVKRPSVELSPLPENQHKKHRLSSEFSETGIRLVTDVSFNEMDDVTLGEVDENEEISNLTTNNQTNDQLIPPPPSPSPAPSTSPSPIPDDKMEIEPNSRSFTDFTIGNSKIVAALTEQAKETNCLWKIKQLQNSKNEGDSWIFTFDVLQSIAALEFKLKPSDDSDSYSFVSDSRITLIHEDEYLTRTPLTVIEFGFSKLEKFFHSSKKIENVGQISYFLDILNSFSSKLTNYLNQILSILEGYPGSTLSMETLTFRLFSFPVLFSSDVVVDLRNLSRLSRDSLSFERHFGELNENQIRKIFDESVKCENSLTDFIISSTKYIIRLEIELGRISKRDHICLLPDYLKKL